MGGGGGSLYLIYCYEHDASGLNVQVFGSLQTIGFMGSGVLRVVPDQNRVRDAMNCHVDVKVK